MSVGSILIGLALLVIVVPVVIRPLVERAAERAPRSSASNSKAPPLHATLTALRDLDFDHQVGKVSDQDHQLLRAQLLAEAAEAMQHTGRGFGSLEDDIEAQVLRLRKKPAPDRPRLCPACQQPLQPGDRYCPGCGRETEPACPACGASTRSADRFCSHCGNPLREEAWLSS